MSWGQERMWLECGRKQESLKGVCRYVLGEGLVGYPHDRDTDYSYRKLCGQSPGLEARSPVFESASVSDLLRDLRQVSLCLWTYYPVCILGKGEGGERGVGSVIWIWDSWARD